MNKDDADNFSFPDRLWKEAMETLPLCNDARREVERAFGKLLLIEESDGNRPKNKAIKDKLDSIADKLSEVAGLIEDEKANAYLLEFLFPFKTTSNSELSIAIDLNVFNERIAALEMLCRHFRIAAERVPKGKTGKATENTDWFARVVGEIVEKHIIRKHADANHNKHNKQLFIQKLLQGNGLEISDSALDRSVNG